MTMQEEALDGTLVATSPVTRDRKPLSRGALVRARLRKMPRFWVGASILVFIVLWAFIGPLLYPYDATQRDFLNVGLGPTQLHWSMACPYRLRVARRIIVRRAELQPVFLLRQ